MKARDSIFRIICYLTSSLLIHTTSSQSPCLPEGISFTTQSQIDSFSINYPGCNEIEGSVYINSQEISSLNGLSQVTSIGGSLKIFYSHQISSLNGLNNLQTIGEACAISWNDNLASLSGLEALKFVGGGLGISSNPILSDLEPLDSLVYVGGNLVISENDSISSISLNHLTNIEGTYFEISHNSNLTSLEGFGNLANADVIYIVNNSSLETISGLNKLEHIESHLQISNNEVLEGIFGFAKLKFINGEPGDAGLFISGNNSLESIEGFDSLSYVANNIEIIENPSLTSIVGFGSLSSIGGFLRINENHNLFTLTGLQNLTTIGSGLRIINNNSLGSLTGLENLALVGGTLLLSDNNQLIDINGLSNVEATSISSLIIRHNSSLSDCDIESICNYLSLQIGGVSIFDNSYGCNSPEEVIDSCLNQIIGNNISEFSLKVFPNPSFGKYITFLLEENGYSYHLKCYNTCGQKVYEKRINEFKFKLNVANWPSGVYYVEIYEDDLPKIRSKFVLIE